MVSADFGLPGPAARARAPAGQPRTVTSRRRQRPLASCRLPLCAGGMEEYYAKRDGKEPPVNYYRPRIGNVAPRTDGWTPARANTQTPPRTGPVSGQCAASPVPSWRASPNRQVI